MTNPIIFLDCDGVVNILPSEDTSEEMTQSAFAAWAAGEHYPRIPHLVETVRLLAERVDAQIVISSTWRKLLERDEFVALFGDWMDKRLHVGWKTGNSRTGYRGDEIRDWFAAEGLLPDEVPHVILDDDSDFHPGQPHIRIDPAEGLTPRDVRYAVNLLRVQNWIDKANDNL